MLPMRFSFLPTYVDVLFPKWELVFSLSSAGLGHFGLGWNMVQRDIHNLQSQSRSFLTETPLSKAIFLQFFLFFELAISCHSLTMAKYVILVVNITAICHGPTTLKRQTRRNINTYFLRRLIKFDTSSMTYKPLQMRHMLSGFIIAWFWNSSFQDHMKLQRVMDIAQSITRTRFNLHFTLPHNQRPFTPQSFLLPVLIGMKIQKLESVHHQTWEQLHLYYHTSGWFIPYARALTDLPPTSLWILGL